MFARNVSINLRPNTLSDFWDRKENAQSYDSLGYPKVLKILDKFLDRAPHVRTFEVAGSTVQKRTARATA